MMSMLMEINVRKKHEASDWLLNECGGLEAWFPQIRASDCWKVLSRSERRVEYRCSPDKHPNDACMAEQVFCPLDV